EKLEQNQEDEIHEHLSILNNENKYKIENFDDIWLTVKKELKRYFEKKNYFKSLKEITREIYKILKRIKKTEDNELAKVIYDYANCLFWLSEYTSSKKYNNKAYEMRKRLYKNKDHSDIAQSLNNLAICY
ncbi:unnamed protein product, partial [Brachionus calyciflorus]